MQRKLTIYFQYGNAITQTCMATNEYIVWLSFQCPSSWAITATTSSSFLHCKTSFGNVRSTVMKSNTVWAKIRRVGLPCWRQLSPQKCMQSVVRSCTLCCLNMSGLTHFFHFLTQTHHHVNVHDTHDPLQRVIGTTSWIDVGPNRPISYGPRPWTVYTKKKGTHQREKDGDLVTWMEEGSEGWELARLVIGREGGQVGAIMVWALNSGNCKRFPCTSFHFLACINCLFPWLNFLFCTHSSIFIILGIVLLKRPKYFQAKPYIHFVHLICRLKTYFFSTH